MDNKDLRIKLLEEALAEITNYAHRNSLRAGKACESKSFLYDDRHYRRVETERRYARAHEAGNFVFIVDGVNTKLKRLLRQSQPSAIVNTVVQPLRKEE